MDDRAAIPRAFVVGDPISHSRSPLIHRTWLGTYGIAGSYDPISVPAEDFPDFIAGLRDGDARYVGGNVTIPHKEAAFRLVDIRDAACEEIGAVNTVWREDGRLFGSNTDGYGFLANLDARAPGWDRRNGRAVVLGAGGASRAVVASLRNRGFSEIHVLNRTEERGRELARCFGERVFAHGMGALAEVMEGAEFFVNTTSLGMDGTPVPPIDFTRLSEAAIVTDIVYVPLETPILSLARTQGIATIDGLGMLLHQAVPGFERWFGVRPEVTEELRDRVIADMRGSV